MTISPGHFCADRHPVSSQRMRLLRPMTESRLRPRFAHFACYGRLEAVKPFDAWFGLDAEGEDRPLLLDIVRSHLPNAEFAFLSVRHAAELTDESAADKALHLAAAMPYCGFRRVVGTMWAVVDKGGPEISRQLYKSVVSGEEE